MATITPINTIIPNCYKNITNKTSIPPFSQDNLGKNGIQQFDKVDILFPCDGAYLYKKQTNYQNNKNNKYLEFISREQLWDLTDIYYKVKDNKDFKELCENHCFNSKEGFFNLLRIMNSLQQQREEKLSKIATPNLPVYTDYSKYDVSDYLKFLNNFAKSNISEDLKTYYIKSNASQIDVYYDKLNYIKPDSDVLNVLLTTHWVM